MISNSHISTQMGEEMAPADEIQNVDFDQTTLFLQPNGVNSFFWLSFKLPNIFFYINKLICVCYLDCD